MGTTVAGVALLGGSDGDRQWAVFNVGDSRVYESTPSGLVQVTVDHSLVQELVDVGVLTAQEAAHHPSRNVVTRSLGREPMVDVSVSTRPVTARSEEHTSELQSRQYLVCRLLLEKKKTN